MLFLRFCPEDYIRLEKAIASGERSLIPFLRRYGNFFASARASVLRCETPAEPAFLRKQESSTACGSPNTLLDARIREHDEAGEIPAEA
jgi:hypothetical protein